ncbi:MAG TPA: hypothetical protein VGO59_20650 [Verrucomicrobiae bacterium]|jgi:hypothetical protein
MKIQNLAIVLGSMLLASSNLLADSLGIDFTGGGLSPVYCTGYTVGYTFQVNSPVTVVGLAAFDPGGATSSAEKVGLWSNGGGISPYGSSPGSLITSATIAAGTLPTLGAGNLFAEIGITPIVLQPGFYDVAAFGAAYTGGGKAPYAPLNNFTTDSSITFVQDSFTYGTGGLAYPNYSDQFWFGSDFEGWFGGNIVLGQIGPQIEPLAVPDSSSSWMLLAGASAAFGVARRKFAL